VTRKGILLWALVAGGAATAAQWLPVTPEMPAGPRPAVAQTALESGHLSVAEPQWTTLPKRETLGKPAGELFQRQSWVAPRAKRPAPVAAPPPAPAEPPAMPYRVAGKLVQGDRSQIVLAKGNAVFTVREGDTLEDGYRVEAIGSDQVTLLYLPLGVPETVPLASAFVIDDKLSAAEAESSSVQARWTGPEQVKAGDPFSVTLKVSSRQAVRAAVPLQLSYDAAFLEPLEVRPGGFFVDGLFNYRINPEGSILIGASGKESVLADAELLIVTFKPIRPGVTAELKISTMSLHNARGRAIPHDQLAAFRTAIVR
jgi:hypothetical protein